MPDSGIYSLQSLNDPTRYVAHEEELAILLQATSQPFKKSSTFKLVRGLAVPASPNAVSFEAVSRPGHYLRHNGYRLQLEVFDGSARFKDDATFWYEPGNAKPTDRTWSSFRSFNHPTRFIRHKGLELWVETGEDKVFKQDTTFRIVPPNWGVGVA